MRTVDALKRHGSALARKRLIGLHSWERNLAVGGALGSGKSEWLLNLAHTFLQMGEGVRIADVDITNPYFCVRERAEALRAEGFQVITSPGDARWGDAPALSPEVPRSIGGTDRLFLDVGGDARGGMALTQFAPLLEKEGITFLLVVNSFRPQTNTLQKIAVLHADLEMVTGLRITGLLSNAHCLGETTMEDVAKGIDLAKEASETLRIPLLYAGVAETLWCAVVGSSEERATLAGVPLWPLKRRILLPWERGVVDA
jgi:hypothetical protein